MVDLSLSRSRENLTGEMLVFNLLGRVFFYYPDQEQRAWLQSLKDEEVFSEAPFGAEQAATKAGLDLLQAWSKAELSDDLFGNMQADYTRLFLGPGQVIAPPWESVYFNDERLTFQEQTLDVRAWYRRFGLEAESIHKEPDDHIGLEMLFIAHLTRLALLAQEQNDEKELVRLLQAERDFFQKHPGAWALKWLKQVEDNARTDFYKGMALLTRGTLIALADILKVKLEKEIPD